MQKPVTRTIFLSGLLLLGLCAATILLTNNADCDDCHTCDDCSECINCHCAPTTYFGLPTHTSSKFFVEVSDSPVAPSLALPDQGWCQDLDRLPGFPFSPNKWGDVTPPRWSFYFEKFDPHSRRKRVAFVVDVNG